MIRQAVLLLAMLLILPGYVWCQEDLEIEQVIAGAYARDSIKRAEVGDMTMYAESYARKLSGDGEVKEEKKFFKNYYFKDTLFKAEFLEYYLEGQLQDEKKLQEQVKEAAERRKKGRNRDASINPMEAFYPENRHHYVYSMPGIEKQHGCVCYHITAECMSDEEELLEGDFWFEAEGLNLVHGEFRPAKMPSKIKQMDMTMSFAAAEDGYWLPAGFYMRGRGKVLIFIKFNFEVEEKYSQHKINVGLTDDFFAEDGDED
jgi:hypothetical protein